MAEQTPREENEYADAARKIVREYLSGLMWSRAQRDSAYRAVLPAADREEMEEKFRQFEKREEDIEWRFGQEVDKWRKSEDPKRRIVLEEIVKALGKRRDLGFFGKSIVERLKRELE